jgi:hypothetical protein
VSARASFLAARSLYRRGLREPAAHSRGNPDIAYRNAWARPSSRRPLCDEAVAQASRLNPRCAEFLGRRDEPRMVSAARLMFEYDNPPMDTGHPYKRQALQKLRSRLFVFGQCRMPLYRFGAIRQLEIAA